MNGPPLPFRNTTRISGWRHVPVLGLLVALSGALLAPGSAWAHGVRGKVAPTADSIRITVNYDDDSPMIMGKVEVFTPQGGIFQRGETDLEGRFIVWPNGPGDWRVVADDQTGHRWERTVTVPPAGTEVIAASRTEPAPVSAAAPAEPKPSGLIGTLHTEPGTPGLFLRALTGFSLIVGVTGIALWWRVRKGISHS